jgi:p-aminobenzoyl-glutamate transporter AbgT
MDDWQVKLIAALLLLFVLTVISDWADISTDAPKTTLVATVITAKSSIRIWTNGTLTPLTDMVLTSTEENAPMATRLAAMLTLDVAANVATPTA